VDKVAAIDGTYPVTIEIESDGTSYRITIPAGVMQVERTGRWKPEEPLPPQKPPLFLQCDERWRNQIYAPGGRLTFCQAGCLVTCVASLAAWAGMVTDPPSTAAALGRDGAFAGDLLQHPDRVTRSHNRLVWHGADDPVFWSPLYEKQETSLVHWRDRPADLVLLRMLLRKHPVVLEVDYKPKTPKVDQHFVLSHEYVADASGGLNDDLLIMDPMAGHTSILSYFEPSWLDWCQRKKVTKVQRTILGARVWKIA